MPCGACLIGWFAMCLSWFKFSPIRFFVLGCLFVIAAAVNAAPVVTGTWVHAISSYVPPKYGNDFTHFEYVNPDAPKGGLLRLGNPDRRTSIDKLNPFTIKGVAPAAMMMFSFESLGTLSMDEPNAMYGLLAESMFVAPDLSSISFRLHPQARFNNGDPVTPADVIDSYNRLRGKLVLPTYSSPLAGVGAAAGVVPADRVAAAKGLYSASESAHTRASRWALLMWWLL